MKRLINLIKSLLSSKGDSFSFKRAIVLFVVVLFAALLCTGLQVDGKLVDALTILATGGIAGNVVEKFSEKDL